MSQTVAALPVSHVSVRGRVCSGLVQWIRGAAAVTKPITDNSSTFVLISPSSSHHDQTEQS